MLVFSMVVGVPRAAHAQTGTLSVDPPTQSVAAGDTFTVVILQDADVVSTGAQTSLGFDPAIVQVVSAEPAPPYAAGLFLFGVAPQTLDDAIVEANSTGTLLNLSTFFVPGTGQIPPGPSEFLVITMQAVGGGVSPLVLSGVEMLDANGGPVTLSTVDGEVVVSGDAAPPPGGATPGAGTPAAQGAATPGAGGTAVSTVAGASTARMATVKVNPATQSVAKDAEFTVDVIQDTAVDTSSVDVAIKFKKDVVELVSIEAGEAWQDATGADSAELEAMVDAANESGELSNVTFLYTGGDSAPAGESTVFSMNMRGRDGQDGTSDIELVSVEMVDADGNDIPTTLENGEVVVGSGGGGGSSNSMLWVVIALVAVGLVGGGGYVVWRRRKAWA
jgi:hypothetical protein